MPWDGDRRADATTDLFRFVVETSEGVTLPYIVRTVFGRDTDLAGADERIAADKDGDRDGRRLPHARHYRSVDTAVRLLSGIRTIVWRSCRTMTSGDTFTDCSIK